MMQRLLLGDARNWNAIGQYNNCATLAFLDPPYNTGKKFSRYDDSMEHTAWLDLLEQALWQVKSALRDDGSIWVTMGGRKTLDCWNVLDDVFGRNCLVADIPWRRNYKATNATGVSIVHDTILVYGKNPKWRRRHGTTPKQSQQDRYNKQDESGRYRLTHAGEKTYLSELMERGAMPVTWFDYGDFGHNEQAHTETIDVCLEAFSYAKPERLLSQIINIATNEGDLVLDSFVGSGTTLVCASKMKRQWLGIEASLENINDYIIPRLKQL